MIKYYITGGKMEKFISENLGKIKFNKVKKALSNLSWEGKGFIEKTNRIDENGKVQENEAILFDVFGERSEAYSREYDRLFTLFNGKISTDNLTEFLKETEESKKIIQLERPIRDQRKPKEELEKQDREFKAMQEEQQKRQEEFDRQSVEIPSGKIGICLDVCFNDSDIMTDYFNRHRLLERRLIAIVRKQSETERLARRIIEQVPELKDKEFTWHTEKYSMGHGNYLEATKSHETRDFKAYDGREEVSCFYEVTFTYAGSDTKEIPHEKYYLGDLSETRTKEVEKANGKTIRENAEKNGVEIIFNSRPDDEVLTLLKSSGWRWSRFNGLWYNRLTPENLEFAKNLAC